jgi:hypothetical protein
VSTARAWFFHLCWLATIAQWPSDAARPPVLTPVTDPQLFRDTEIDEGDTCIDDEGDEIFTETARG